MAGTTATATGPGVATYWKNGTATSLTDGTKYADAYAIAVDGNGNVYVAGYTSDASGNFMPTYWKNGTATNLPNGAACGECALASGITLSSH